jgi:hypothetical protein
MNWLQYYVCWFPYPHFYITGITPNGTGNATHTGNVIFKRYVTGTSAAKPGLPHSQTYFTGIANDNTSTVLFWITIPVLTSKDLRDHLLGGIQSLKILSHDFSCFRNTIRDAFYTRKHSILLECILVL